MHLLHFLLSANKTDGTKMWIGKGKRKVHDTRISEDTQLFIATPLSNADIIILIIPYLSNIVNGIKQV